MSKRVLSSLHLQTIAALISRTTLGDHSAEVELFCTFGAAGTISVEPSLTNYQEDDTDRDNPVSYEGFHQSVFEVDQSEFHELIDNILLELPNYDAIEADAGLDLRDRFKTAVRGYQEDILVGTNLALGLFITSEKNEVSIEAALILCMENDSPTGFAYQSVLTTEIRSVFE